MGLVDVALMIFDLGFKLYDNLSEQDQQKVHDKYLAQRQSSAGDRKDLDAASSELEQALAEARAAKADKAAAERRLADEAAAHQRAQEALANLQARHDELRAAVEPPKPVGP